jgi:hypothetical protein
MGSLRRHLYRQRCSTLIDACFSAYEIERDLLRTLTTLHIRRILVFMAAMRNSVSL